MGIMAIYAGAPFHAALIMGIVLEFAKLVTVSWVYRNWETAGWKLKGPMVYAIAALMLATSVSVFGFLTKSHLEQGAATIDNSAKIERIEQQIAREKSVIADDEKVIIQLDTTINSYLGTDRADRAVAIRRTQAPQRKQLRDDIAASYKKIDDYSNEKFKLQSQVRALQLEVGPIRYIAELFYSSNGSEIKNIESAVKAFTILIVSTLDPLAVILLIAANYTLLRVQDEKKRKNNIEDRPNADRSQSNNSAGGSSTHETLSRNPWEKRNKQPPENVHTPFEEATLHGTLPLVAVELNEEKDLSLETTAVVDAPPAPSDTSLEIPIHISKKAVVNEEETTEMEDFLYPYNAPPPVVRAPGLSRVGFVEDSGPATVDSSANVGVEIPAKENWEDSKPWAHSPQLLETLIGREGLQRRAEENKKIEKDRAAQNLYKAATVRNRDKYPEALSWLAEFKKG